jgi:PAS domain S-box-containing protein
MPDGTVKHVNSSGHPVLDENGELIEFVGTAMDVTERKRADEMLREAESRFRTYVDHATDALFVHDGRKLGKIIDVNRQACESLGYTREELIGMTPLDFDPNMDEASVQRLIDRIDAGEIVTFETSHRSKGGAVFPVEVRVRPFRYEGHPLVLSLARNITDQKRAEESLRKMQMELAHANRIAMMGQLTASIAHEVNQPIATARNNASAALKFLDRNPRDLAEVREALGCVVNDSERASAVIDRIREHIKKAPTRKESFDLNDAITEVIALTRVDVANSRVRVQTRLAEGLPPVEGDRVQLQQVALNLILNAVEAMSSVVDGPRELLISTEQTEADGVLVAVHDSGPGIDPKGVERLFESFYTTKSSGLGLGLSICRSIVEARGGRLWAEANKPRGAAFQFTVPAPSNS